MKKIQLWRIKYFYILFLIVIIFISILVIFIFNKKPTKNIIHTSIYAGATACIYNNIKSLNISVAPIDIYIIGASAEQNNINNSGKNTQFYNFSNITNIGFTTTEQTLLPQITNYITQENISDIISNVPNEEELCHSDKFSFMDYKKVTDVTSRQYALLNSDKAYTDTTTGIRMYSGLYCVAVGTFFGSVGDIIDVTLENGSIIHCVVGDQKSDLHTDITHRYAQDGSVVEMIVDQPIFQGTFMYPFELKGRVLNIENIGTIF